MKTCVGALLLCAPFLTAARAAPLDGSTRPYVLGHAAAIAAPFDEANDLVATTVASYALDEAPRLPPTAVYDISARVVVLPDGSRLEAHSGLAERADDPRFIRERMRGPTPPAVYVLEPRARPFHGIDALRLKPVDGDVFGRTGLLAHTYMLHGRPESNGCVVFRDYATFLRAFRDGRIKRLRVVPAVGDTAVRGSDA